MEKLITFAISLTEDRAYVASSSAPPYFCFEEATQEQAVATARRALDFYFGGKGRAEKMPPQPREQTRLIRARKIRDEVFTPAAA